MKKTTKLLSFFTFAGILFYIFKQVKFWLKKTGGNEGWITETTASWSWRYWSNLFFLTFLTLYNRLEIRNKEAVTKKVRSHCVVVANHESILDGFILSAVILKLIYFMVKKEAFERPIAGYYLRKVACFPVDRSKNDASAIKKAFKLLDEGESLGIFAEGTRNKDGFVSEFKHGAIKIAIKKKVPIVPVYIGNSHNITPKNSIIPRPAKLIVCCMEPIDTAAELKAGKTEKDIIDMLYKRITDTGSEVMGYDVRDPKYVAALEAANKEK